MIKLKLLGLTCLLMIPITGVSTFALLSLPVTGDSVSGTRDTGELVCPCPPPSEEDTIPEDTGDGRNDGRRRDGGRNDSDFDSDNDTGTGDNNDSNDDGTGDDGTGDDGNDGKNDCDHSNRCPECGDCIDCGNDPCPDCCDEDRWCDECINCTFDIGMEDGKLQYTGSGLLDFRGGVINKGATNEGFWVYSYTPVGGTGALLDESGLPLRVGRYSVTGTYDNGIFVDSKTSTLTVTPAPVNIIVTLERDSKIYDGTTVVDGMTAELSGIFGDDIVEISEQGIPSYISPDAGCDIAVIFSDFKISGIHAWNYQLIQPENQSADIKRAQYEGDISVVINDDPLRIGTELTFSASCDPADYLVQWLIDDEEIDGADDITYVIQPCDADKKITVALVSPCRNYEGVSPPTSYIPYTIMVFLSDTVTPMANDHVFFGTHGNYTAYAASKNGGFVDVDYILQDSGFGTDSFEFTGGTVSGVSSAGAGKSRYFADPDDAVNGVIVLKAAAYHIGVSVSPGGSFAFDPVECGIDSAQTHTVTISQLGNAPTGSIYIKKSGDYPYEYGISTQNIPNIDVGSSYELDISIDLGSSPPGLSGYTFNAYIDITGENIADHSIPLSVKVDHNFSTLEYRGGFHDHSCIGCKYYSSGSCNYSSWISHSRSCTICKGPSSHDPSWTAWVHGTVDNHSRTCAICALADTAAHTWGNWGAWTQGDTINHTRTGSCTTCARPGGSNSAAHTWGGWSAWINSNATNHERNRSCTTCSRPGNESVAHSFTAWANINSTTHSRNCTVCGRSESGTHSNSLGYTAFYAGYHTNGSYQFMHIHDRYINCVCGYTQHETPGYCTYNAADICVGTTSGEFITYSTGCGRPFQNVPGYTPMIILRVP